MVEPRCGVCGGRHHPRQAHRFASNGVESASNTVEAASNGKVVDMWLTQVALETVLKQRREIEAAAEAGDEYAKILKKGYDECNPAVLGMPWPECCGATKGESVKKRGETP